MSSTLTLKVRNREQEHEALEKLQEAVADTLLELLADHLELTDDMQEWREQAETGKALDRDRLAQAQEKQRAAMERTEQLGKDDPVGLCRPGGALRILTFPPFRKFLQMPGLFVILSERDVTYRQIFTDGRTLPDDPTPTFNGYSVGRWDGDTLIVTSNGFRDGTWLDRNGSPMSDVAKLTERYRRVNYGRLEIDVTLDDPKVYTRPWTVTLTQLIVLDTELLDYHCMDNERDAGRLVGK